MLGFDADTLKYFIQKIKTIFATSKDLDTKVDKVAGKGLSTNNFSDNDITNINNSFDDVTIMNNSTGATLSFYSTTVNGEVKTKKIYLDI